MRFTMFSRFTFEQSQWIIPVTEKSLSEQCEGGLICCATAGVLNLWGIPHLWGMASCQVAYFVHLFPPSSVLCRLSFVIGV